MPTFDSNNNNAGITSGELKLRVAEHIIAQYDCSEGDQVRSILAETKVGVQRRSTLFKQLKTIFTTV